MNLAHLADEFDANGVDWDLLAELTNDDLKDIGVSRLADRRVILKAIAELQSQTQPEAGQVAERRQITVAFVDMVDSTGLSGRLDPEDFHDVLMSYQEACSNVIAKHHGQIARLLGDGILIYFGYPRAMEDDAHRAILSCLEMQKAIAALPPLPGFKIRARMGIATGTVVVADIHTKNLSEEGVISGDTPIIAARLQSIAKPDAILVADSTVQLSKNKFVYEDAGIHDLKGIDKPEQVWQVIAESNVENRFQLARSQGGEELLGRETEMRALQDAWSRADAGAGCVAVLSGDAGIGKSHLTHAFCREVEKQDGLIIRLYCSHLHEHSALYPVISYLEAGARLRSADSPQEKLHKLGVFLGGLTTQADKLLPLLANLLSIPLPADEATEELSPERQKEMTFQGLQHLLESACRNRPAVLVVDDLHWIDPSTREFLTRLTSSISQVPVLLLMTCRPNYDHPWANIEGSTQITVGRLSALSSGEIIRAFAGETELQKSIVDEIISRADGVPLFLEELTRSVICLGTSQNPSGREGAQNQQRLVPASLYESLMARVDGLKLARDTVLQASVIGRSFTHKGVSALSLLSTERLDGALNELMESGLVVCIGDHQNQRYEFKHSLIQELCYQSLIRGRRADIHRRYAVALETQFPEITRAQPETIARHFSEAGEPHAAIGYWETAGALAIRRSATIEALSHFKNGLDQISLLKPGKEHNELKLTFLIHYGSQMLAAHGFGATDVQETYRTAMELCQETADSPTLLPVYWGLWGYNIVRANLAVANKLGKDFLDLSIRLNEPVAQNAAQYTLGVTAFYSGEFDRAMDHFDAGLACYDPAQRSIQQELYGQDLAMGCYSYQAWIKSLTGDPKQALSACQSALKIGDVAAHAFSATFANIFAAQMYHFLNEAGEAKVYAERAAALSSERGFAQWAGQATVQIGRSLDMVGDERGFAAIRAGWEAYNSTGAALGGPYVAAWMAESYARRGEITKALSVLEDILATNEANGERYFNAELMRLKGEYTLAQNGADPTSGLSCLHQAVELASVQGAHTLLHRAEASLAAANAAVTQFTD